jgi:hypothetical protein
MIPYLIALVAFAAALYLIAFCVAYSLATAWINGRTWP